MSGLILYVDTSEIRTGQFKLLQQEIQGLAEFVRVNEPRIYSYQVYFDDRHTTMSITHMHPDAESLDYHLRVAGPLFAKFTDLVKMVRIDLFGEPSPYAIAQLKQKAESLGSGAVIVHSVYAGFNHIVA